MYKKKTHIHIIQHIHFYTQAKPVLKLNKILYIIFNIYVQLYIPGV